MLRNNFLATSEMETKAKGGGREDTFVADDDLSHASSPSSLQ